MPRIFPIIKKVTVVTGGGGNVPPGAAVMTDSVGIAAHVFFGETNAAPTDAQLYALAATYPETNAAQTEALRLGAAGFAETNAAPTDVLVPNIGIAETNAAQTEATALALTGFAETNVAPAEALKTGFAGSGLAESNPAPAQTVSGTVFTYATTQTNTGASGITNPGNVTGQNDAANAVLATVALGTNPISITPKIPRASVPGTGTYTFYAWYKIVAGATSTFTLTYTDTGGNPVNITLTQGDFSVTPFTAAITSLHATNDITVLFQVQDTLAGAATNGSIQVDAVAIRTVGAF